MTTLSAILLVGGQSRRMGVDKASVVIAGETMWQRQTRILSGLGAKALWVSARTAPAWVSPPWEVIIDEPPSRGPLSGVAVALGRLETSHLLVLAIDLPRMTTEHLRKLWCLARRGVGVIPWHDDYFEPLCAIYPAEALSVAEELLAGGDLALQHLAQRLVNRGLAEACNLTADDLPHYLNMNTASDLIGQVLPE
ncbi:MAG TPA: molybdenum cofactor guanylyltransferase [Verrucomicrobiae bacterium]|jgi:molybdopterin-guanine dinucleotide biosynthesis protein A|nr:molybdenum cofactor guanylyltransferase [Verrucomicrobiae bacterium]